MEQGGEVTMCLQVEVSELKEFSLVKHFGMVRRRTPIANLQLCTKAELGCN